jgi:acyl-CoA synthetase (AMP-forming)/AMP-acid ligase II
MLTGRKLVVLRQFEPREWLEAVQREQVTHAFVVPTMMKQLLDHADFDRCNLGSLQNLSYGGAAMPFPVIRQAVERFPKSVGFVNAFGQTETTSTLTVLGPDDHRLDGTPEDVERTLRRLRSIGRPLPDVEVKVVDDDGNDLPTGQVGELWVRTPRVMKGYAATEGGVTSPMMDDWLPTRDMGWIDEDGYIVLAGRKDDMIIRGGENIAPAEVEAVLYSHPLVDEAAVIGMPDVEWGQRIVAVVALRRGHAQPGCSHRTLPPAAVFVKAGGGALRRSHPESHGEGVEVGCSSRTVRGGVARRDKLSGRFGTEWPGSSSPAAAGQPDQTARRRRSATPPRPSSSTTRS